MVIVLLILSAALLCVWYTRRRHLGKEMEPNDCIYADPDGNQPGALTLNPTYAAALQPTFAYDIVPEFAPVYVTTEFAPVYVTAEAEAARGALANPTYEAAGVRATADATVTGAETHGAALANPTYEATAAEPGSASSADPAQLNGYEVVDTAGSQDQTPQYAVVNEGGSSGGSGDPEYASVEHACQDADDTSSSTGDQGVYAVLSPAGNSRLGMQVVRVAEDEFC